MEEIIEKIFTAMEKASGLPRAEILDKSRRSPLPAIRWFIGNELMILGYSSCVASKAIGIDHATLLYGRKQIPIMSKDKRWKYELDIYNKFKEIYNADRQEQLQS